MKKRRKKGWREKQQMEEREGNLPRRRLAIKSLEGVGRRHPGALEGRMALVPRTGEMASMFP